MWSRSRATRAGSEPRSRRGTRTSGPRRPAPTRSGTVSAIDRPRRSRSSTRASTERSSTSWDGSSSRSIFRASIRSRSATNSGRDDGRGPCCRRRIRLAEQLPRCCARVGHRVGPYGQREQRIARLRRGRGGAVGAGEQGRLRHSRRESLASVRVAFELRERPARPGSRAALVQRAGRGGCFRQCRRAGADGLRTCERPLHHRRRATETKNTSATGDDTVAAFSGYGRSYDGFARPDIVAPGRYMVAPAPVGSVLSQTYAANIAAPGYLRLSGTSFSAPVVAGAAAQVLARHPGWTPDQVKGALMQTANPVAAGTPQGAAGAGELDAYSASRVTAPINPNAAFTPTSGATRVARRASTPKRGRRPSSRTAPPGARRPQDRPGARPGARPGDRTPGARPGARCSGAATSRSPRPAARPGARPGAAPGAPLGAPPGARRGEPTPGLCLGLRLGHGVRLRLGHTLPPGLTLRRPSVPLDRGNLLAAPRKGGRGDPRSGVAWVWRTHLHCGPSTDGERNHTLRHNHYSRFRLDRAPSGARARAAIRARARSGVREGRGFATLLVALLAFTTAPIRGDRRLRLE